MLRNYCRNGAIWGVILPLLYGQVLFAQDKQSREPIVQHLEFLGYQCEPMKQGVKVTHPSKIGFLLVPLKDGIMIQAAFAGIEAQSNSTIHHSADSDLSRLTVMNELNKHASVFSIFLGRYR